MFSYDSTLKADLDQVRFLIQDTDDSKPLIQDEEITWSLTTAANVYTCAADLCDILVNRARGVKSKQISEFKITYDPGFYRQLSGTLRARGLGHQVPYVGGVSITDKEQQQNDTDAVQPRFRRKQGDNPQGLDPSTNPDNPLIQL